MSWIYFLKHKSEAFKVFVDFYNMICTQFQAKPHIFRTDNGREYVNSDMHQFFTTKGIIHQTSCRDTPQQNGVAERKKKNFTRNNSCYHARILCSYLSLARGSCHSKLPHQPSSHKSLNYCTPLNTLKNHNLLPFAYSLFPKIFGCTVFVHCQKRM